LVPFTSTDSPREASIIALMMEAVQASETLVNSYQSTRRYNPEDSHLRTLNEVDVLSLGVNTKFHVHLKQ
jgi:hypothetical protein